jgi:hypothetical protein
MNIYVFTEVVREEEIEEHKRTEMRLTWMEADRESDADEDKMDRHGQSSGNTMLARE